MKSLHVKLSHSMWEAIENRHRTTGEPVNHIVRAALAEYLQIEHATLFQVSTSTALVEGIYQGAVNIAQLRQHGDFGLGTFEGLDGEMVALDGHFFHVRSDGKVREAADSDLSPFAVVTRFQAEKTIEIPICPDFNFLTAQLDKLRTSSNVFYAIRVDGAFDFVHTRAMCKSEEGTPLVVAAAHQPEFRMREVRGTMVGFWSPEYTKTIEVPGYHLHFITDDRASGGHVLELSGSNLSARIQQVNDLQIALPENEEFLRADLTRDPAKDLDSAEHAHAREEKE
ncbi:MAG TPA: acetolactate decarboxylase [Candidatus Binataceae bacterium]|nr:acetolactate decarboxylase [Candidatus Binataceae bacterium]